MAVVPEILVALKDMDLEQALSQIVGMNSEKLLSSYIEKRVSINELIEQAGKYAEQDDYQKVQYIYEEILQLDPNHIYVIGSMPNVLIEQSRFSEAMTMLKNKEELEVYELDMLAELYLISDLNESLKYVEMSEEKRAFTSPFGDAIRQNISDPVSAYLEIINKDLIMYEEIVVQLKVKLKEMYPDDPRVQNL